MLAQKTSVCTSSAMRMVPACLRVARPRTTVAAVVLPDNSGTGTAAGSSHEGPTSSQVILSKNSKYFDVCLADSVEDACWVNDWAERVTVDVPDSQLPTALAVFEHLHTDALPHDPELLVQMCVQASQWQMDDTYAACLQELLHTQLADPAQILSDDHLLRTFVNLPYDILKPWADVHGLKGDQPGLVVQLLGMWTDRQRAAAGGEVTERLAAQLQQLSSLVATHD